MASRMLLSASARVSAWLTHPGNAGTLATYPPSSSCSKRPYSASKVSRWCARLSFAQKPEGARRTGSILTSMSGPMQRGHPAGVPSEALADFHRELRARVRSGAQPGVPRARAVFETDEGAQEDDAKGWKRRAR